MELYNEKVSHKKSMNFSWMKISFIKYLKMLWKFKPTQRLSFNVIHQRNAVNHFNFSYFFYKRHSKNRKNFNKKFFLVTREGKTVYFRNLNKAWNFYTAVIAKKHVYHNVNKVENQCKCLCNLNLIDIVIYVFLRYNGSIKKFGSWFKAYTSFKIYLKI